MFSSLKKLQDLVECKCNTSACRGDIYFKYYEPLYYKINVNFRNINFGQIFINSSEMFSLCQTDGDDNGYLSHVDVSRMTNRRMNPSKTQISHF